MYNLGHGLADAKSGRMRCLRPRLDSICGASDPLRQQAVPEHALGPRWSRWTYARGKKQEEARSAKSEAESGVIYSNAGGFFPTHGWKRNPSIGLYGSLYCTAIFPMCWVRFGVWYYDAQAIPSA